MIPDRWRSVISGWRFWLLLAALGMVFAEPAGAVVYVSGTVLGPGGKPLKGATLLLYPTTDPGSLAGPDVVDSEESLPNGSYVLRAPAPGQYRLTLDGPGTPVDRLVKIPAAGVSGLDLDLRPLPGMQLKLLAPGGAPVSRGAAFGWVWLLWGDRRGMVVPPGWPGMPVPPNPAGADVPVRPDGMVQIPSFRGLPLKDVTAMDVDLRVAGVGMARVRLDRWPTTPVTVQLSGGARASGMVTGADGKPMKGARVGAIRLLQSGVQLEPPDALSGITDQDGHYEIPGLFPGLYRIGAMPGRRGKEVRVTEASVHVDLDAAAGYRSGPRPEPAVWTRQPLAGVIEQLDPVRAGQMVTVAGKVLDGATGAPVVGAWLGLQLPGDLQMISFAHSGQDGSYALKALPQQSVGLRADAPGKLVLERLLQVPAAGLPSLDLKLSSPPVAHVTVVGPGGQPLPPGPVEVYYSTRWGDTILESAETQGTGTFEIQSQRYEPAPGDPAPDEPRDILIAVRRGGTGYAQAHFDRWPKEPVTLTLRPARTLSGVVQDEHGHPLSQIPLFIGRTAHTPGGGALPALPIMTITQTDANGRFQVTDLPQGTYSIEEVYRGNRFRAAIVTLRADHTEVTVKP